MSVSIQSETSKDEVESEDTELEDLVWNLMSRSGLLPEIQGQIAKFIEDNGKAENVHIFPERADRKILGLIFEYLQWVGLKQTNSVLLSETPVDIDLSFIKSSTSDPDYRPELCRILEDQENETEDRATPTRSHNYSKDEFEDSRLSSNSGRQSVDPEAIEEDVNSIEVSKASGRHHISLSEKKTGHESPIKQQLPDQSSPVSVKPRSAGLEMGDSSSNDLLINFDSPVAVKPVGGSYDMQRPNVTVRQRFDLPDPFLSPNSVDAAEGQLSRTFTVPSMSLDGKKDFISASSLFKIPDAREDETGVANFRQERSVKDVNSNPQQADNLNLTAKRKTVKESLQTSPDDESSSDLTLTIEDDTQDVSIQSQDQGMSSCEHAVNLK